MCLMELKYISFILKHLNDITIMSIELCPTCIANPNTGEKKAMVINVYPRDGCKDDLNHNPFLTAFSAGDGII